MTYVFTECLGFLLLIMQFQAVALTRCSQSKTIYIFIVFQNLCKHFTSFQETRYSVLNGSDCNLIVNENSFDDEKEMCVGHKLIPAKLGILKESEEGEIELEKVLNDTESPVPFGFKASGTALAVHYSQYRNYININITGQLPRGQWR